MDYVQSNKDKKVSSYFYLEIMWEKSGATSFKEWSFKKYNLSIYNSIFSKNIFQDQM